MDPELFASADTVADLEAALARDEGSERLASLVALAWHLRQRDSTRALQLAAEADAALTGAAGDAPQRKRQEARLLLVRAEANWLHVDLDRAAGQADAALAAFEDLGNPIGMGDAHWVLASIWGDQGSARHRDENVDAAMVAYSQGSDPIRFDACRARRLLYGGFRDQKGTAIALAQQFDPAFGQPAAVTVWLAGARALVAGTAGNFGNSIQHFMESFQAALECGQLRQAILAATNAADDFSILGDFDTALEWDERAVTLARASGWPSMIGNSLMQTGNVLRLLGRRDEARAALREAQSARAGLEESNGCAIALGYLGDLALDAGQPAEALDYFRQAEDRARSLGGTVLLLRSWRGQANALSRLDQPEAARAKVAAALALAEQQGNPDEQIEILRVCAELHARHALAPPDGMTAPSAALHYLDRALAVAATIPGFHLPSDLLDEVARAHAGVGDYRAAYSHALAAAGASDSRRLEQARNRAIAMRARQELEQIQAEAEQQRRGAETAQANARAEQHRVLAEAEAARAAALQAAGATLETLGQIGREITASLDSAAVFSTLNRHVTQLFDVTSFDVYLLDGDGRILCGVFGIEAGEPSELIQIAVDDPTAYSARCVRERREVVIHNAPDAPCENLVPGTRHRLSLMFAPLLVGERVLGVMSIQSPRAAAYGERERSIFATLCAYGAIALDNATAYASAKNAHRATIEALEELRQSEARRNQAEAARESLEAQLRESQKMQAIGTLAGGIAHDFNNILAVILGNVELARSDVHGDSPALESLDEIRKAGERARDLVQRILSFSRRQPAVRKPLALSAVVPEAMRLLRATLPARLSIEATCAPNTPLVMADATLVQQTLINLCTNSMQAIPEGPGRIEIRLDCVARDKALAGAPLALNALDPQNATPLVRLVVRDDGHGMDEPTRARIFEPFFTTKPVDQGTGLGLSVVHGIVQAHEGAIAVDSQPGAGTTFIIYFPASASVATARSPSAIPRRDANATKRAPGDRHLLYIDDDEVLVRLIKRLMERRGYRVSSFVDQREALSVLSADPMAFDIVVTDYNMPGLSGLDVAREVRSIREDLPVAIASGFIDETLRAEASGAGVRRLIFKASAIDELCDAFEEVADSAQPH